METLGLESSINLSKVTESWDKNQDLFSRISFFATTSFCLFSVVCGLNLGEEKKIVSYSKQNLVNMMDDQLSVME